MPAQSTGSRDVAESCWPGLHSTRGHKLTAVRPWPLWQLILGALWQLIIGALWQLILGALWQLILGALWQLILGALWQLILGALWQLILGALWQLILGALWQLILGVTYSVLPFYPTTHNQEVKVSTPIEPMTSGLYVIFWFYQGVGVFEPQDERPSQPAEEARKLSEIWTPGRRVRVSF